MDGADILADRWATSRRTILIQAGLLLRESRAPNSSNMHAAWYAHQFPMEEGSEC